ncbi:MAG: hypothetical protein H0V70_20160 [Ktedonobacteraceae bacterium]|nr:hypothetical protein [Ktedonobacteraceae bacterium]
MIQPIVLEGTGDAVAHLAIGIAPTVIRARIVHRSLARARGRRGRLGQIAQLVRMGTITIEVLLLGAAPILGALPELAQIGVGILIGVIATERALVGNIATRPIACGGHGGIVAGPDQAVLLVITEVLRLAAAGATLPRDGGFGGTATQDIAHRIIADLVILSNS